MWRQNPFFFFLTSSPSSISCFIIAIGELCTCVAPSLGVSLFKFAISLFHFHKKSPLSLLGVRSSRTAGIYFSSFMYMFFHGLFLVELSNAWLGVHISVVTWCWFPFIFLIRAHFRKEKIIPDFYPFIDSIFWIFLFKHNILCVQCDRFVKYSKITRCCQREKMGNVNLGLLLLG